MTRRLILCLCLLAVAIAAPAGAAAPKKKSAASAPSTMKRKAVAPKRTVAKRDSSARTVAAPRRLEDIHIEGEIPAPQVLFVTARDQRRFTKFHHRRYLKSSVQVGETTLLPTRVALTSQPTTPAGAP
jgi:cell envelope opacity-associated protein A